MHTLGFLSQSICRPSLSSHNQVDVRLGVCTSTQLWIHLYFQYIYIVHCGDFSLFSIFFSLRAQKAQKRKTNNVHPVRSFYARFVTWFWLLAGFCFILCLQNLFVKKILWLKIVLAFCAFAWLRLCAFGAFGAREIFL